MTNIIFKHFNNDVKQVALAIRENKNKQLLLELLKTTDDKHLEAINSKDWKFIISNLDDILKLVQLENQKKILSLLVMKDIDLFFENWKEFNLYYSGYKEGQVIGYHDGYNDSEENKNNKIVTKEKNLVPIRQTEVLDNDRIKNWILGEYDSIEEAQADCSFTSQTEAYLNLLSGRNVFLTGPAGSGKSFVLNQYVNILLANNPKLNIIKTSTTGISATNIDGITIHSFLSCEPQDYNRPYHEVREEYLKLKDKRWKNGIKKFKKADVIIIDEISMMSKQFFSFFVERYKEVNSKAQIIISGDFSQLPPVATKENLEKYGKDISEFCFDSEAWKYLDLKVCYLDKLYRTKDERLSYILNEISLGRGDQDNIKNLLLKLPQTQSSYKKGSALLLSINANVDKINQEQQDKNPNKIHIYKPVIRPDLITLDLPQKVKERDCKEFMIKNKQDKEIKLKVDDTVMVTANIYERDLDENSNSNNLILANGTIGTFVYNPKEEYPFGIQLKNKSVFYIKPRIVQKSYVTLGSNGIPVTVVEAAYEYLPLKLSYAITIHKSQGQSFSDITCDLTNTFMEGLGYVALSRAKSYDGITLLNKSNKPVPFNSKSLEIGPQSLDVKQKTQLQAKGNRKNSIILLQSVFENPLHYINNKFNTRKVKK